MNPNQQTTQLIDRTIQAFNGDVIAISPTDGITLIDRWISALHSGDASTNPIASALSELKMELQRSNPNIAQVESILVDLADQAQKAAQKVDGATQSALMELSSSLKSLSDQISGKRGPANTSGRAPMTSTVGDTSIAGVANVVATPGSSSPTSSFALPFRSPGLSEQPGQTQSDTGSTQGDANQDQSQQSQSMTQNTQGGGSYGSGYGTGSSAVEGDNTSGTGRGTAGDSEDMDDNASRRAGNTENTSTSGGIQDADTGILSPTDADRVPVM